MYLNLGCGSDYIKGFKNIDLPNNLEADIHIDLEEAQLPFGTGKVSFIQATHVLEHISNLVPLMLELARVLKPGGVLYIKVPHCECYAAFADPTHVRYFHPVTFFHFTDFNIGYKTGGEQIYFDIGWLQVIKHNRPTYDEGVRGKYFTEIEIELVRNDNEFKD